MAVRRPSALRSLVNLHFCACRPAPSRNAARFFSHTSRRVAYTPPRYTAENADELKRRYNPPAGSQKQKSGYGSPSDQIQADQAAAKTRILWSIGGVLFCVVAVFGTVKYYEPQLKKDTDITIKNDGPAIPGSDSPTTVADENDKIPTGTSTIPFFPRTITLSSSTSASTPPTPSLPAGTTPTTGTSEPTEIDTEYQLLGLGIRTVSIFSIQVYVVGLYIATQDIANLQERLIRMITPIGTTLVPGEKKSLQELLLDPERGQAVWNALLKDGNIRTAFRIVPTRNTDFIHMRDGFVRGITARSAALSKLSASSQPQSPSTDSLTPEPEPESFSDPSFPTALNTFKSLFSSARRKLPTNETLYILRSATGQFQALHEDKNGDRYTMGEVDDERISRLLWLNYLAGKQVSSEDLRKSVVEGCMEITGRPVGSVLGQVI